LYCLERRSLGSIAKNKGQFVSIVGVLNFQGANEEFNRMISIGNNCRERFYSGLLEEY